jgi:AcrR family transcriptional regulator
MAAPKGGTRERILDAAERLFAERGFEGASTRDIVARSGDTIGSVNYHFGSKNTLIAEVIRRRWDAISADRQAAYDRAVAEHGGVPPVESVVACVVLPYLRRGLSKDRGWRSYVILQTRVLFAPKIYDEALQKLSEPIAREYLGWLRAALPAASLEDLGYSYQFMISSMVECCAEVGLGRMERITDGACDSSNFDTVGPRLAKFISAGIRAICQN